MKFPDRLFEGMEIEVLVLLEIEVTKDFEAIADWQFNRDQMSFFKEEQEEGYVTYYYYIEEK